ERGDRATFVAGRLACLLPIRQREAARPEVRAQLRPVDLSPTGHQHEHVVALAATDDDRPEELVEADALEPRALFGARWSLGPDEVEIEARGCRGTGAGGQIIFHAREPYRVGCRTDRTARRLEVTMTSR